MVENAPSQLIRHELSDTTRTSSVKSYTRKFIQRSS